MVRQIGGTHFSTREPSGSPFCTSNWLHPLTGNHSAKFGTFVDVFLLLFGLVRPWAPIGKPVLSRREMRKTTQNGLPTQDSTAES
jgi:hypothetical protein